MAQLLNKVLNFVGWESDEEEEEAELNNNDSETVESDIQQPAFISHSLRRQQPQNKVVSMHQSSQFKVVVMQPVKFEDAQDICEHLKNRKPVVINLEDVERDEAQRIIDFLSGSVFALDGNIQKVSNSIFLVAPSNVDLMGDNKESLKNKAAFSWAK